MNLKTRLKQGETVSAPGVFDPFSARIADKAGFDVLYMTGYGVNATLLGEPDAGFASYSEMVGRLQAIVNVTDASVIADGDTGFGGLANVERAVAGYEVAGADAIQLEDQEFPKRCGHTRNRKVIAAGDMVKKIQVAAAARASDDFLVIARTDALSEHGIDEACSRAESYLKAGADILFIESPENESEMNRICETFKGTPLVANMVAGGRTPLVPDEDLFAMGFQIVIHPIYLLGAALDAMSSALASLRTGSESGVADISSLNELLEFSRIWDMDERYR
jgi:2-methylisocitrate lyase-like PEP mutase family enzyme